MKTAIRMLGIILLSGVMGGAFAYDLPPLNLGFTTFLDAAPPAGNGWYFSQYVQHYRADKFKDKNGDTIRVFPDPDVNVTVGLSQAIYISEFPLLGGNVGITFILPEVSPHTSYDAAGPFPQAGDSGFGDLLVGPFIQWPPVMGPNGPKFFQRIELSLIMPTGEYDRNREINPGSNFWSFDPYWSGTYFFTPDLTASIRAHYLWNGKNDDPNRNFVGARHTRAGQAFHMNFAAEYAVLPQLRVGVNGYWLKQTTDTEVDGNDMNGRREKVLGLGAGGMYSFSKDNHLIFNYYRESEVENRTEGDRFNFRWVHHF